MNEKICYITNKWKTVNNEWEMMTVTFFKLYIVYNKKIGQFFFHTYFLTGLKKDTSVL